MTNVKGEIINIDSAFGHALSNAARSRGFTILSLSNSTEGLLICDDCESNRKLLLSCIENNTLENLSSAIKTRNAEIDLLVVLALIDEIQYTLLFSDSDNLSTDPQCLAVRNVAEKRWIITYQG